MVKQRIGRLAIYCLPAANVIAWVVAGPADDGREAFARQVVGEMLATTTVVCFAMALLLSSRARFLEPFFGGLDKMYRNHREVSVAGFFLLITHVAIVPWRLEPGGGVPAGLIAFVGFVVLILLSLGPRLKLTRRWVGLGYRSWKRTHRFIGFFFVFACAHMFLVKPLVIEALVPLAIVLAAFVVGIGSFIYNLTLARLVRPSRRYLVEQVSRLNDNTAEVVLSPRRRRIPHRSGQFVFVRFKARRLRESHPFTVASSPDEETLRLVIKASGDFTVHLVDNLRPGTKARVEGSYGMLDHRAGRQRQIWISGGIGVTPFLSWLRDGAIESHVDFFYTVRHSDDAVFADEIISLTADAPNLQFHLNVSSQSGSLTPEQVAETVGDELDEASVYLCGPIGMIQAFERGLTQSGANPRSIHYEEFSFR